MHPSPLQSTNCRFIKRFSISLILGALANITLLHSAQGDVEQNRELVSKTYSGVLGTSMTLAVLGVNKTTATRAMEKTLMEIQKLDAILSSYRDDSEISVLNRLGSSENASPELIAVVRLCEAWRTRSKNNFSCKLGGIIDQWQEATISEEMPNRVEIRKAARAANRASIELSSDEHLISLEKPIKLNVSGLAKGYIIDRAFEVLLSFAKGAQALKVDIGGDGRYWAASDSEAWQIEVSTDPRGNDTPQDTSFTIRDGAVAASGHRDRGYLIGRRSFSHILKPRDGWPPHEAPSAIVVTPKAVDADAIATALAVMEPTEGVDWANQLQGTEALLVIPSGQRIATFGWTQEPQTLDEPFFFEVNYEIPEFSIGRYRRPYVAMWITTKDRKLIRNLLLLGENQRWAKENSNWWRGVGRRDASILKGLARPTRRPGQYRVVWDGRDDFGNRVMQSELVLHIEAAREHGGVDYLKLAINANDPKDHAVKPYGEIGRLDLSWLDHGSRVAH